MDGDRFDAMTRAMGASRSRRGFLRTLAGGLAAAVTGAALPGAAAAPRQPGGNSDCAQFCADTFGENTRAARQCTAEATKGRGLCFTCGPASAAGTQSVCCARTSDGVCASYGGVTCPDQQNDAANCGGCGLACPASTDPCQVAVCAGGVCDFGPGNDGATCDDGNLCTTGSTCLAGACVGTDVVTPTCVALDTCHVAGTCEPLTGLCSNPNAPDVTTSCEDGLTCTTGDYCLDGVCQRGAPVECPNPGPCQESVACDPATGECVAKNKPEGTLCGADGACSHDICLAGTCVLDVPKPVGTPCDDENSCTGSDACDGAGTCISGTLVTCPAADACHDAGTCDGANGLCGPNPISAGTCFVGGTCYASGDADPANPCQVCDPTRSQTSFSAGNEGGSCDDGDRCTTGDVCRSGVCTAGTSVVCTASDQCHVAGVCDPTTGQCSNPDKANGATCDDGDAATCNDVCQAGVCTGSPCIVCPPNTTLMEGLCCRPNSIPRPDLGFCVDCGGALDFCCPGDVCRDFGTCRDGRCQPCGVAGNQCCSGGSCNEGQCLGGICVVCGGFAQSCCPGDVCGGDLSCIDGRCLACGSANEPCCAGGTCDSANTVCFAGTCRFCGVAGQPCCAGGVCESGTACFDGTCQFCGVLDFPPCGQAVPPTATPQPTTTPQPTATAVPTTCADGRAVCVDVCCPTDQICHLDRCRIPCGGWSCDPLTEFCTFYATCAPLGGGGGGGGGPVLE